MSEQKPGLLGRLFGRRGAEPDPAASRSEGAPDLANAAAAGELAPVEPTVTQASPDADEKLPAELAGADLQPVETVDPEGGVPREPIPRREPERGIGLTAPAAPAAPPVTSAAPVAPAAAEPKGWWRRLSEGMRRTSSSLNESVSGLFTKRPLDAAVLEDLEDVLVRADLGLDMAARVAEAVGQGRYNREVSPDEVKAILAAEVEKALAPVAKPLAVDRTKKPFVVMVVGVNGAGKTTTVGKLAAQYRAQGLKVTLAAGDTFRAAAIEQLQLWGERVGAPVIARAQGSDAAGLAFDALEEARAQGADVLLLDTAGRLQNKAGLMAELEKILRVLRKLDETAPHAVLLVLDATVGQNALSQVELFGRTAGVSGLVMTKLDGTARGGILVALAQKFGLPVHFVGVGEGVDDLQPFSAREFARAVAGLER